MAHSVRNRCECSEQRSVSGGNRISAKLDKSHVTEESPYGGTLNREDTLTTASVHFFKSGGRKVKCMSGSFWCGPECNPFLHRNISPFEEARNSEVILGGCTLVRVENSRDWQNRCFLCGTNMQHNCLTWNANDQNVSSNWSEGNIFLWNFDTHSMGSHENRRWWSYRGRCLYTPTHL